jgi:ATP-binding cassette subfamily C protein
MLSQLRKILDLLDRATIWQGGGVAVLILVGAALDAIGIALIFPFIKLVTDPLLIHEMTWLTGLIGEIPQGGENQMLVMLAGVLVVIFVIKNMFLLIVQIAQNAYVAANESALARRMLGHYLLGPYDLHLTRNSAELIRNITTTVTAVFSAAFIGFVTIAAEICLVAALGTVLLIAEPMLTLFAVTALGVGVGIFYFATRRRFVAWGERELTTNTAILQSLQQSLHSIKEVKVLGIEERMLESFAEPRSALARLRVLIGTTAQAPRLWVETIMVAVVMGVVIGIITLGGGATQVIAALTLFAAAAFRMIPSMNRILGSLASIKNAQEAVNAIHRDAETYADAAALHGELEEEHETPLPFEQSIRLDGVVFQYPSGEGTALDNIDLEIAKGESIGIAGPSGAGKTTLVDIILALLRPSGGRVLVDGTDLSGHPRAWRQQIGYVPQAIYLTDDTLRRNVAFGLADTEIDDAQIWHALRLASLDSFARELPEELETTLGEQGVRLSGGQRQRIGIARALYRDPPILVLDEATSSLDSETEHEINRAIESLGGKKTLIIIAHRLSTIRKCNRIVYMDKGRIAAIGDFEALSQSNSDFRRLVELSAL